MGGDDAKNTHDLGEEQYNYMKKYIERITYTVVIS